MDKGTLAEKFDLFQEQWSPKIVAELNRQYVKLAKLQGEFVWHHTRRRVAGLGWLPLEGQS